MAYNRYNSCFTANEWKINHSAELNTVCHLFASSHKSEWLFNKKVKSHYIKWSYIRKRYICWSNDTLVTNLRHIKLVGKDLGVKDDNLRKYSNEIVFQT